MIHSLLKINTHEDKQSYVDNLIYLKYRLETHKELFDLNWYAYCSSLCVISFPTEDSVQLEFIESKNPGKGDATLLVALIAKEFKENNYKKLLVSNTLPSIFLEFFENMGFREIDGNLVLHLNR